MNDFQCVPTTSRSLGSGYGDPSTKVSSSFSIFVVITFWFVVSVHSFSSLITNVTQDYWSCRRSKVGWSKWPEFCTILYRIATLLLFANDRGSTRFALAITMLQNGNWWVRFVFFDDQLPYFDFRGFIKCMICYLTFRLFFLDNDSF